MNTKKENPKKIFTSFTILNVILFLAVIGSNLYFFYFKKNFEFIVETSCDPSKEECTQRDCSNPDYCPPNGLSIFKRYTLKASDFKYCLNEDCKDVCESEQIKCEIIPCYDDQEMGESCLKVISEQEI